jgi:hypothetical protein
MDNSYNYALLRFAPDKIRGERVNIGLVIFKDGHADVRLTSNLAKAQALVPNEDLAPLWRDLSESITDIVRGHNADIAMRLLAELGPINVSPVAQFRASDKNYEASVDELLKWLVTPIARISARAGTSRLATHIRAEFKKHKLLAASVDEINDHKVVVGYELPGDDDLSIDFALKNGAYRFTQVVDYRTTPKGAHTKIKEVSLKAIAIHQAPRAMGVASTQVMGYALVWVPPELADVARPHLKVLSDFTTEILHYDVPKERERYWSLVNNWVKAESPIQ